MALIMLVVGNQDYSDSTTCFLERFMEATVEQYFQCEDARIRLYDPQQTKSDLVIIDETIHRLYDGIFLGAEIISYSDCPPLLGLWGSLEGKDKFEEHTIPCICIGGPNDEFLAAIHRTLDANTQRKEVT